MNASVAFSNALSLVLEKFSKRSRVTGTLKVTLSKVWPTVGLLPAVALPALPVSAPAAVAGWVGGALAPSPPTSPDGCRVAITPAGGERDAGGREGRGGR